MPVEPVNIRLYPLSPEKQERKAGAHPVLKGEPQDYKLDLKNEEAMRLKDLEALKEMFRENLKGSDIELDDLIQHTIENLVNIKKFFPPYPPQSEERIKEIERFIAFRALIERLTIPPEKIEEGLKMVSTKAEEKSIELRTHLAINKAGITSQEISLVDF